VKVVDYEGFVEKTFGRLTGSTESPLISNVRLGDIVRR